MPAKIRPLPEQKAILNPLATWTHKSQPWNKNKGKYKNLKQGMMEELLTRKTRLKYDSDD